MEKSGVSLSLGHFAALYKKPDFEEMAQHEDDVWCFLLKTQEAIMGDFYEKLRLGTGVSAASKAVPPDQALRAQDFTDFQQWLLGPHVTEFARFLHIPWYRSEKDKVVSRSTNFIDLTQRTEY